MTCIAFFAIQTTRERANNIYRSMKQTKKMVHKVVRSLLFSLCLSTAAASANELGKFSKNLTDNEEMRFAGAVNGKAFFVISSPGVRMTWLEAVEACKRLNMTLAEITTAEQADLLKSAADSGQIWETYYWVNGRDAWEPRQFTWQPSGMNVAQSGIQVSRDGDYPTEPLTCLLLRPGWRTLLFFECNSGWASRLCEVPL